MCIPPFGISLHVHMDLIPFTCFRSPLRNVKVGTERVKHLFIASLLGNLLMQFYQACMFAPTKNITSKWVNQNFALTCTMKLFRKMKVWHILCHWHIKFQILLGLIERKKIRCICIQNTNFHSERKEANTDTNKINIGDLFFTQRFQPLHR